MPRQSLQSAAICEEPAVFDEAMKLIGDFWTLRLIDAIQHDEVRFCEIERRIPEINPATLTSRLKKLEVAGAVERRTETKDRQSVTYRLTDRGQHILPVIQSIKDFTNS